MLEKILQNTSLDQNPKFVMKIQDSLLNRYKNGELEVVGAMVKSKSNGEIVGHLQQTNYSGDFDLSQLFGSFLGIANLAVSAANLGVSIAILNKVNRIEQKIDSIEKKLDQLIADKLRSDITELKELTRRCSHLLEFQDPKADAINIRDRAIRISGELYHNIEEFFNSKSIDINSAIQIMKALNLCQSINMLTYFISNELKVAQSYGHEELERLKNVLKLLNNSDFLGWTGIFGIHCEVAENIYKPYRQNYEYKNDKSQVVNIALKLVNISMEAVAGSVYEKKQTWKPFDQNAEYKDDDVKELVNCIKNPIYNMASQVGIANTLEIEGASGLDYLKAAGNIVEEPVVFLPVKN